MSTLAATADTLRAYRQERVSASVGNNTGRRYADRKARFRGEQIAIRPARVTPTDQKKGHAFLKGRGLRKVVIIAEAPRRGTVAPLQHGRDRLRPPELRAHTDPCIVPLKRG